VTAVSVPASSANLGAGFDALAMALSLRATIGVAGRDRPVDRALDVDVQHPARVAYRDAGGRGELWVRSPIPMGRGLGFSGAMRVGGAAVALAERLGDGALGDASVLADVFAAAARLEGHADNAAASTYGGIVVAAAGRVVPVVTPLRPEVVMWVPGATTSTDTSRGMLPATVPLADAAFNIGRSCLLVAALAAGDAGALRAATEDRLHQERRLGARPDSAEVLEAGLAGGAWCGWLSGSGPSVAFLAAPGEGHALARSLPEPDRAKVLSVAAAGVRPE